MAIVTIANETGCGEVMYTKIAKDLNYKLFNRELMGYVAALSGIKERELKRMDEKQHSRLHVILNSFFDFSLFSSDESQRLKSTPALPYEYDNSASGENFKYATEKVIRMIANDQNAVIVGRGSNIILRDNADTIHIYVCADLEQRVANISKSMGISEKDAIQYANSTDQKKINFIKYYYNEDMTDVHHYHLVLNVSLIPEEKAADLICGIIKG